MKIAKTKTLAFVVHSSTYSSFIIELVPTNFFFFYYSCVTFTLLIFNHCLL